MGSYKMMKAVRSMGIKEFVSLKLPKYLEDFERYFLGRREELKKVQKM